jgi:hypothetical protein
MPTSAGQDPCNRACDSECIFLGSRQSRCVVAPFRALCTEITAFLRNAFRGDDVVRNELSHAMLVDYSTLIGDLLGEDSGELGFELPPQRQVIVVTPDKLLYVLRHSPEWLTPSALLFTTKAISSTPGNVALKSLLRVLSRRADQSRIFWHFFGDSLPALLRATCAAADIRAR